jgi:hypothetical protein
MVPKFRDLEATKTRDQIKVMPLGRSEFIQPNEVYYVCPKFGAWRDSTNYKRLKP